MIQVLLRIVVPVAKRNELLNVLRCLKGPTEFSRGCRGCWIFQEADKEGSFACLIRWDTKEELEEHVQGERFRNLLPYMDMSLDPPEVEVSDVNFVGGMGFLVSMIGPEMIGPD